MDTQILLGTSDSGPQYLLLNKANFHGIVAGATGTGKTTTLQTMAQRFSANGVPVFAPDVKGDLGDISLNNPVKFWDLVANRGQNIKLSIRDLGPELFARILELNDTQEGVIMILFMYLRDYQQPLDTLDHVRQGLAWMIQEREKLNVQYGGYMVSTISTIQRKILRFKLNGMDNLFGPTNFSLGNLIQNIHGRGVINILRSEELISNPMLYSTFLFWLLNQMLKVLPEVGNPDRPKLVFFFDEAHLLFDGAPKNFLQTVERVIRLVRSKGVGVYFVTQNPADIPDSVLAQLGNRIQHALRAYTPNDQKGLKAAAQSFRTNPAFDTADAIQQCGVGEALVSVLDNNGTPTMVQRTRIAAIHPPKRMSDTPIKAKKCKTKTVASPVVLNTNMQEPTLVLNMNQNTRKAKKKFSLFNMIFQTTCTLTLAATLATVIAPLAAF
jgi:hypothetical protein